MKNSSRRDFLKKMGLLGATGLLSFGNGLSFAQSFCTTQRKILVNLKLGGGVDSKAFLPPLLLQSYHDKHPNVGILNPLQLNAAVGLHPAMSNLHSMFSGTFPGLGATFFNQVGFLNTNMQDVTSRSHEVATLQYAAGHTNPYSNDTSGWLGRYAALHCGGGSAAYSLVNLNGVARTLRANSVYPVSASRLSDMVYTNDSPPGGISGSSSTLANNHIRDSVHLLNNSSAVANEHQQLYRITHGKADSAVDMLAQVRNAYSAPPAGVYVAGNPLNQRFMDTAALINSWNMTKVTLVALEQGGYDSHGSQRNDQQVNGSYVGIARNLFQLDQALGSFYTDLSNRGIMDDVVVMITSEFGRGHENGNLDELGNPAPGTDHGTGGLACLIGSKVRRVIGYANYTNSQFTSNSIHWLPSVMDIRSIYAAALESHLGVASGPIFPEPYIRTPLQIFT